MLYYQTEGLILAKKDCLNDDGLFIILTKKLGKIIARAKSVKKSQSKLASHLGVFNLVNLNLVASRSQEKIISAIAQKTYPDLRNNFNKIAFAFYAAELVDQLVKEKQTETEIFELLDDFFSELDKKEIRQPISWILSLFIFKLLFILGYRLEFFSCASCGQKITPGDNYFSISAKGLVCNCGQTKDKTKISDNAIKILRLLNEHNLNYIIKIKVAKIQHQQIINLANEFLRGYLEKELKSQKFLELIKNKTS